MRTLHRKTYWTVSRLSLAQLSLADLRGFVREERRLAVKVASTLTATLLTAAALLAAASEFSGQAHADTTVTTTNSAQFGMTLPSASLPSGQDEIHSSDGTSCRSAVGGNGAYLDMGVIGAPSSNDSTNATAAAYSRVVIPLGETSKRLDCSQLYALEIQRLKMEIALARMGAAGSGATPQARNSAWADEGWNDAPAPQNTNTAKSPTRAVASASPVSATSPTAVSPAAAPAAQAAPAGLTSLQGNVLNALPPPEPKKGSGKDKSKSKSANALPPSDPQITGSATLAPAVTSLLPLPKPPAAKTNWISASPKKETPLVWTVLAAKPYEHPLY